MLDAMIDERRSGAEAEVGAEVGGVFLSLINIRPYISDIGLLGIGGFYGKRAINTSQTTTDRAIETPRDDGRCDHRGGDECGPLHVHVHLVCDSPCGWCGVLAAASACGVAIGAPSQGGARAAHLEAHLRYQVSAHCVGASDGALAGWRHGSVNLDRGRGEVPDP